MPARTEQTSIWGSAAPAWRERITSTRMLLVAIAAMNTITGLAIAFTLAPLSWGLDARVFRDGAMALADDRWAEGFLYTPVAAFVATPLTWVTSDLAAVMMTFLELLVLVAGTWWATRRLATADRVLVILAALGFAPVVNELLLGQVTILIGAAIWVVRDHDTPVAGIPLGMVVALVPKPLVIPILLWMLVWRRRACAGALATVLVATLSGLLVLGPAAYIRWGEALVGAGSVTRHGNLAITSLVPFPLAIAAGTVVIAVTCWAILRNRRLGFVFALLAGLLLAPYTLLYSASVLLVAVEPAVQLARVRTAALALVANILMVVAFPAWCVAAMVSLLPWRRGGRGALPGT
jgi:hypothetical protein